MSLLTPKSEPLTSAADEPSNPLPQVKLRRRRRRVPTTLERCLPKDSTRQLDQVRGRRLLLEHQPAKYPARPSRPLADLSCRPRLSRADAPVDEDQVGDAA